jgi:hypothetical protein
MAKKLLQALGHGDGEMAIKAIEAYLGALGVTTAVANAAGQTLTAAAVVGGFILRSGAAAVSDTLPSAAALIAALPNVAAGTTVELLIPQQQLGHADACRRFRHHAGRHHGRSPPRTPAAMRFASSTSRPARKPSPSLA